MAEPASTPANEKVPSVYQDARSEPYNSGDHKSPISSGHSDGTAAPRYEGPSTGTAAAAHTGNNEKAQHPLVDTKHTITDAQPVTSPTNMQTPTAQVAGGSAPQTAHDRAATAESKMSAAAKVKLNKNELKEAKQLQKMLDREQKERDQALKHLIKELNKLQAVSKSAARDESKATSKHSKAVKLEHTTNKAFVSAQGKHDKAVADLKLRTDNLAKKKEHAATHAATLEQKRKELEQFRANKAVADRERQAKIQALSQNPTGV